MNSRFSLVVFLFHMVVPMDVPLPYTYKKECGESVEFTCSCDDCLKCDPNNPIKTVALTISNNEKLMEIDVTDMPYCSPNGKFCVKFSKDRKWINLTVHDVHFRDQRTYTVNIVNEVIEQRTFNIFVKGVCKPKLSSSTNNTDKLECEVDVESANKPTIVWMDKNKECYQEKPFPENVTAKYTTLRDSFTLTNKTRNVEMCCIVSYKKEGKLEDCQIQPSHVVNDVDTGNKIMIIILCACLLGLAFGIGVVFGRRGTLTRGNRERTFSEVGLIEDQAENIEGAALQPLQRPQDQV